MEALIEFIDGAAVIVSILVIITYATRVPTGDMGPVGTKMLEIFYLILAIVLGTVIFIGYVMGCRLIFGWDPSTGSIMVLLAIYYSSFVKWRVKTTNL